MFDHADITVCTVSYHHAPHLRMNFDLAARLNPESRIRWIVGENSPKHSALRVTPADMPAGSLLLETDEVSGLQGIEVSQHHVATMQLCLDQAATRYVLVLDPDFYPIRPNWVHDVVAHMGVQRLAIFGAPWSPRHPRHYRSFPCVHFTMVDREAFSKCPYTPAILMDDQRRSWLKAAYYAPGKPTSRLGRLWRMQVMRRLFPTRWVRSWSIFDTGSELFARYWAGEPIASEAITPVFEPKQFRSPKLLAGRRQRLIERIMPEYMSYLPKQTSTYALSGSFVPKTRWTERWEEFLWRGDPFGFHMRGHRQRERRDAAAEVAELRCVLDLLTPVANGD